MSGSPRSGSPRPPAPIEEAVLHAIEAHLQEREQRRTELAEAARKLRRKAQSAMTELHAGTAEAHLFEEIRKETRALAERARREGGGDYAITLDGLQEGIEALLLDAVANGRPLPGPETLGVEAEVFLLGLGDLVGEVRRLALRALTVGDVAAAERDLLLMEQLAAVLLRFEAPRAIVALKPKQDAARALVERTRGEVALGRMLHRARLPISDAHEGA